jgi:dihydrofolate reductase
MGKIALSLNISLDGVMQTDGKMQTGPSDVPFKYESWEVDFGRDSDFDYAGEIGIEQVQNADAILLGRVTYEIFESYWPTAEGALADRINQVPKYVVSSTLTDTAWNATVLGDGWPDEVARLRKELDGDILVYGSRRLCRGLIERGLVDELRLLVAPLVLGAGGRLFEETDEKIPLRLVEARPLGGDVVHMIYAPATGGS